MHPRGLLPSLRLPTFTWLPAILTAGLLSGCASSDDPATGILHIDLMHRDPVVRLEATLRAESQNRVDLIELILENLEHNDINVRMVNGLALKRMTGKDFEFRPHDPPFRRTEAISRWRAWLEREGWIPRRAEDPGEARDTPEQETPPWPN